MEPLGQWASVIYNLIFYRALFTEVNAFSTLLISQASNLFLEIFDYPFKMTLAFQSLKTRLSRLRKKSPTTLEETVSNMNRSREEISRNYFWVCMGQRLSVMSFLCALPVLHYGYNADFYPFQFSESDDPSGQLNRLWTFTGIMLLIEWTGSTIVWFVIWFGFDRDVIVDGVRALSNRTFNFLSLVFAIRALMDAFLSLNSHTLIE